MRIAYALSAILLFAGCAPAAPGPSLWVAERGVVWCYRTLAAPDCQRQPQPGAERRLIAAAPEVHFTPASAASTAGLE